MYSLYTDGSAIPNPGKTGSGAVLLDNDENIIWTLSEYLGQGTNNTGELTAIHRGCQRFSELQTAAPETYDELTIYTDSELCVHLVNCTKKTKKPHLQVIVDRISAIKANTPFTIQWVKAHANIKWNEYADRLANAAIISADPDAKAPEALFHAPTPVATSFASSTQYPNTTSAPVDEAERMLLKCSFTDKDKVKSLGARWNPDKKAWWVAKTDENIEIFKKWIAK